MIRDMESPHFVSQKSNRIGWSYNDTSYLQTTSAHTAARGSTWSRNVTHRWAVIPLLILTWELSFPSAQILCRPDPQKSCPYLLHRPRVSLRESRFPSQLHLSQTVDPASPLSHLSF